MKTIEIRDRVFLLNTRHTSYLFMVNEHRHLEHLHYGNKIRIEDAEALRLKHYSTFGTTIMYDESDQSYTLDQIPQEFSAYGKGDFKEPCVEVLSDDSYTLDLTYDSYEIIDGDYQPYDELPAAYGCGKTLVVHLLDKYNQLKLDLYYAVFPDEDIIVRSCLLRNEGKPAVLHKLMSASLDIMETDLSLMSFTGAWDKETHLVTSRIENGKQVIESRCGSSSAKTNPGFIIRKNDTGEDQGKAWGFNLIYSGNHYSSISYDEYGITHVITGISPERFSCLLNNGDHFLSPQAVLSFSDRGLNELSAHFHDFINRHIVRGFYKEKERPVLINSWEAFGFDFSEDSLLALAFEARDLGIELFVLDDGWFGRRDSDLRGLGDYDCNRKKIPGGIKGLSRKIHELGMSFGIWVEPEAINPDSKLYEQHPEYALNENKRPLLLGRHELLMDLSKKEVQDYIIENVSALLDENEIDYIKWDMNRLTASLSGEKNHEYLKGLYRVLKEIFYARPHILFESCSSGGNRFDLGLLCYSQQVWSSDDTDPLERISIQKGLSYLYPLSCIGAHVSASPHAMTLRKTPLETRFHVACFGDLGYELDLSKLSAFEKAEIKKQIAFYKKHRRTFQYGRFYRLKKEKDYESFEVLGDEGIVAKYRFLVKAAPVLDKLFVEGLAEEDIYEVRSRDYNLEIDRFSHLLEKVEEDKLNHNENGISDGLQYYEASGAALKNGIVLNNLYLGTGYAKEIRISLDCGSDLYIITKK